ncbi:DNA repair protein RecN [uncultured Mucilaginibacter sp.]|uniref:DNA repair protein RecN n=1 Tax=uncultured Mucilaginibacter sp. TaxID=797541 RepID=UPI00261F3F4C|nr:DNA repair protein RecN [uncultured Mucilaginibacter sp.]
MLSRLTINNYALIDNLDIAFDAGLNIMTGETGAGKSIILGALSLILGQRTESKYFFNQQKKCVIEGLFRIDGFHLKKYFEENDLDYEAETVLRREINSDGKSRAFVNDTPVNLASLKQLGEKLIDIHSQHATAEINDSNFQLLVVDSITNHSELLEQYRNAFFTYKKSATQLQQLIAENEKAKSEEDYLQFQFDELEKASLVEDEQETLEQELYALNNAEEIKRNLLNTTYLLQESETAALNQFKESLQLLNSLEKFNPKVGELVQRLTSINIELKDIVAEIEDLEQATQVDEVRTTQISDRLALIFSLQKKHRVSSNSELLKIQEDLSDRLNKIQSGDDSIENLQKQLEKQKTELQNMALALSKNRQKAIPEIEKQILKTLADVDMGQAVLKIENNIAVKEAFDKNGIDHIRFLFSANKGHKLAEMSKVASGGELSRVMLSIKSLISRYTALPTIIFDEIDTGVSGEVANKVGLVMEQLSKFLQVVTITHLPQIASKGHSHYLVYKNDTGKIPSTKIKKLTEEERVLEVAKMLSGSKPGESALQNARELLNS